MGNDKRYQGEFTPDGLVGKMFVRKAELSSYYRVIATRALPNLDSNWAEIHTLVESSCKLMARKSGAVARYAIQHWGGSQCCKTAQLKLQGHATYGVSKASMPIWMRSSLDGYWKKGWHPGRVLSWTRNSENVARVVVESLNFGGRYEITLERGVTDGSNLCFDVSPECARYAGEALAS